MMNDVEHRSVAGEERKLHSNRLHTAHRGRLMLNPSLVQHQERAAVCRDVMCDASSWHHSCNFSRLG
eukprot:15301-Eustigmatos_ZCMA.PRE.1